MKSLDGEIIIQPVELDGPVYFSIAGPMPHHPLRVDEHGIHSRMNHRRSDPFLSSNRQWATKPCSELGRIKSSAGSSSTSIRKVFSRVRFASSITCTRMERVAFALRGLKLCLSVQRSIGIDGKPIIMGRPRPVHQRIGKF